MVPTKEEKKVEEEMTAVALSPTAAASAETSAPHRTLLVARTLGSSRAAAMRAYARVQGAAILEGILELHNVPCARRAARALPSPTPFTAERAAREGGRSNADDTYPEMMSVELRVVKLRTRASISTQVPLSNVKVVLNSVPTEGEGLKPPPVTLGRGGA